MRRRLAIIVPYRDRAAHLAAFVPHLAEYFRRRDLYKAIRPSIHVIEQHGSDPFNLGRLKNCGFLLTRETSDYFCFHDVDYLPLDADYSWTAGAARLIWHGLMLAEDRPTFFGGVVLFGKAAFAAVNGYPNCYWGWGQEDVELRLRCQIAGLNVEHRDGTFMSLQHRHRGFAAPGVWTDEARTTYALLASRRDRLDALMTADGISTMRFAPFRRTALADDGRMRATHHVIDIGRP